MKPGDKFKLKPSVRGHYKTIYYEILDIHYSVHLKCYANGGSWECFTSRGSIERDLEPVSDIRFNYFIKHGKELSKELSEEF